MAKKERRLPWHLGYAWRRVEEELKKGMKFSPPSSSFAGRIDRINVIHTHLIKRIWDLGPLSTKPQRLRIIIDKTFNDRQFREERWIVLSNSGLLFLRKPSLIRGDSDWTGRFTYLMDILLRRDQWIGKVMLSRRDALNELIDVFVKHERYFRGKDALDNCQMFRIVKELEWAVAGFLVAAEF